MDNNEVAARLKSLIHRNGYSMKKFSVICNCGLSTLSAIVNNKYPISDKQLERFSEVLGVSIEYLKCETNDPTPHAKIKFDDCLNQNSQTDKLSALMNFWNKIGYLFRACVAIDGHIYLLDYKTGIFIDSHDSAITYSKSELIIMIKNALNSISYYYELSYTTTPDVIISVFSVQEFYNLVNTFIDTSHGLLKMVIPDSKPSFVDEIELAYEKKKNELDRKNYHG